MNRWAVWTPGADEPTTVRARALVVADGCLIFYRDALLSGGGPPRPVPRPSMVLAPGAWASVVHVVNDEDEGA